MGDYFGDFGACDTVFARFLKVVGERGVGDALADERGDGDEAAVAQAEEVVAAPHFTEKYIVVETGKFRGEISERVASGGLHNLRSV